METLLLYLLKSGGLMVVFYISYHFLFRKETFFNINRWFLLTGLVTSVLLPLFFIKKVVIVEKTKLSLNDLIAMSGNTKNIPAAVETGIDWSQILILGYLIIVTILLLNVFTNLFSLFRLLRNKQVIRKEQFAFVDLNENISPFSFFNYIVYNSTLYTNEELDSILNHEKVHSSQKHSVDILTIKLFCIAFWFNPIIWLYKKAITQNLEYIADQKAVQKIQDKRAYQIALLKVVTNQNCLSITNNFYQSLIKKRIVMLNKNQSKKSNLWKYAFILPLLVVFMLYFQVKVIAQERNETIKSGKSNIDLVTVEINKNTSDEEMKKEAEMLKNQLNITLKFSKVKRNNKGEITSIKIDYKDAQGSKGTNYINGTEPIKPITFYKSKDAIGFGKPSSLKEIRIIKERNPVDSTDEKEDEDTFAFSFNDDVPEAPEAPEMPEVPEAPEAPEVPEISGINTDVRTIVSVNGNNKSSIIIRKKDSNSKKNSSKEKPLVIVNGKIVTNGEDYISEIDPEDIQTVDVIKDENAIKLYGSSGKNGVVVISTKDINKITKDAMKIAKEAMERTKPEMERAKMQMEASKPEMERAKAEMEKAKVEMLKAKDEMIKAKAELEKARQEAK